MRQSSATGCPEAARLLKQLSGSHHCHLRICVGWSGSCPGLGGICGYPHIPVVCIACVQSCSASAEQNEKQVEDGLDDEAYNTETLTMTCLDTMMKRNMVLQYQVVRF